VADEEVTYQTKESDVWLISFAVTFMVIVTVTILICAFWDGICTRIVITGIENGLKQGLGH